LEAGRAAVSAILTVAFLMPDTPAASALVNLDGAEGDRKFKIADSR